MQVLKAELHKLFIKRFFVIAVVVLIIVEGLTTFSAIRKSIVLDGPSLQVYKTYINKYSGEITDEKKAEIESLISSYQSVFDEIEKLNEDYAKDNISTEDYNRQIEKLSGYTDAMEGFNAFERAYNTALSTDNPLVDVTAWNCLFTGDIIDIFLVLVLILLVISLVVHDEETGINVLKFSTKNGKKDIYFKQLFIVIITSFLLSILISLTKFLTAKLTYGLNCYDAPVKCFEAFTFSSSEAGVLKIFIVISLLKAAGGVMLSLVAMAVGCLTRTSLYTAFGTICSVYLPGYIFMESKLKYFVPLPSSLLMGEGYFKPEIIGETVASGENYLFVMNSKVYFELGVFAFVILAVFAGLVVLTYIKLARRKSI